MENWAVWECLVLVFLGHWALFWISGFGFTWLDVPYIFQCCNYWELSLCLFHSWKEFHGALLDRKIFQNNLWNRSLGFSIWETSLCDCFSSGVLSWLFFFFFASIFFIFCLFIWCFFDVFGVSYDVNLQSVGLRGLWQHVSQLDCPFFPLRNDYFTKAGKVLMLQSWESIAGPKLLPLKRFCCI